MIESLLSWFKPKPPPEVPSRPPIPLTPPPKLIDRRYSRTLTPCHPVSPQQQREAWTKAVDGPEHRIQKEFFRQLYLLDPFVFNHAFCVPNSAPESQESMDYYVAEGLRSGIPDVLVAMWSHDCTSGFLFIEFKAPGKKPSPTQWKWFERLVAQRYAVYLCFSPEEGIAAVKEHLGLSL